MTCFTARLIARSTARSAGIALGVLADAVVADPRRAHPVSGYGRLAAWVERSCWADSRTRGAAYALGLVALPVGLGVAAQRAARGRPVAEALLTAAATWAALGGTTLAREGRTMADLLDDADVPAARRRLRHLCGRDPEVLDAAGLARASVESVAENTSDAVVAPLLWGALAGPPGLLGYRAVNTLDAMVGHRSPRYRRFGWASARLDDLANWLPARATAALATALAARVGGRPRDALRAWRRDAPAHPSPNAGRCEAAFAGALGVRIGGPTVYSGRTEERPALGDGDPPSVVDIRRAVRLSRLVGLAASASAVTATAATAARATVGRRR